MQVTAKKPGRTVHASLHRTPRPAPDPGRGTDRRRAARGSTTHLAAVAAIAHQEELWQLCRDELTGVDVRIDGWDIRGRWFGVVIAAVPRLGELPCGETVPWRVIAAQIAPANAAAGAARP